MKNCLNCSKKLPDPEHQKYCNETCLRSYKNLPSRCRNCNEKLKNWQKFYCSISCEMKDRFKNDTVKMTNLNRLKECQLIRWSNPENRRKQSLKLSNYKKTEEHKKNLRLMAINRSLKNGQFVSIGNRERELLDAQEVIDSCKIQRQHIIRDLGYAVDGYCSETNTVYEVYEKAHSKKVFEDLIRENRICNHLGCDFQIIWEK